MERWFTNLCDTKQASSAHGGLSRACPCAACQGEPDVTGKVLVPKVILTNKSFELRRHQVVGGYAVQFFWADGHNTGIYSFDFLRRLGEVQ